MKLQKITGKEIKGIIERFDFDSVRRHLLSIQEVVPTVDELKLDAARLLVDAAVDRQDIVVIGENGFRVYKFPWGIELVFAVDRAGSF